jgi:hypothetical protein
MQSLFAKSQFQAFLFVGGVLEFWLALLKQGPSQDVHEVVNRSYDLALAALAIFALSLLIEGVRRPLQEHNPSAHPTELVVSVEQVRASRGFILFGILLSWATTSSIGSC